MSYEDEIDQVELPTVTYGRTSVKRDDKTSHIVQDKRMRSYCETYSLKPVGHFSDVGVTAFKKDIVRPEFERAMEMIESGQAKVLLVWKLDRLTRNVTHFWNIVERLDAAGATFQSVTEPFLNTASPMAKAIVGLFAAMAEEEASGIQERARSWHQHRRDNRMVPIGARPYGFDRPKKGQSDWVKGGSLKVNESEAAIIKEVASRVLDGDSLRGIARELTARGIPTVSGRPWSHSTLRTVLLNPTTYGATKDGKEGCWDSILSLEDGRAIEEILSNPNRVAHIAGGKEARKLKHMLPGLITCGRCLNQRMVTMSHTAGRQYGCDSCSLSIMGDVTDAFVNEWILDNISEDEWARMKMSGKGTDPRAIEELQGKIDDAWVNYYGSDEANRPSKMVFDKIIASLTSQLQSATTEPSMVLPQVNNLHNEWWGMSNHDRRLVIAAKIESITVLPYCKGQTGTDRIKIEGK
jgi:site-specific DNA recombinase